MIEVGEVYKELNGDILRISCDYSVDGNKQTLWYETSKQFEDYVSLETCDSFFIVLVLLAFKRQEDIKFKIPVSKKLHFGFNHYLQEIFHLKNPVLKRISIDCEISSVKMEGKGVATAMSLGVDSFHTLLEPKESNEKINYLSIFNAGAFGQDGGEKTRRYFHVMKAKIQKVCDELSLPLLWVDTNLNEILGLSFIESHTFRNISCALLFQKEIGTYYYSSTIPLMEMSLTNKDAAHYDFVNSIALSTESLEVRISGLFTNRLEKTKEIITHDITKKYLNVCIVTTDYDKVKEENGTIENCSKCFKCIRTMVTLDVLGVLDDYGSVFDLKLYSNKRSQYLAEILYHYYRSKNVFSREIKEYMDETNFVIPLEVYYKIFLRGLKPIFKSLKLI